MTVSEMPADAELVLATDADAQDFDRIVRGEVNPFIAALLSGIPERIKPATLMGEPLKVG